MNMWPFGRWYGGGHARRDVSHSSAIRGRNQWQQASTCGPRTNDQFVEGGMRVPAAARTCRYSADRAACGGYTCNCRARGLSWRRKKTVAEGASTQTGPSILGWTGRKAVQQAKKFRAKQGFKRRKFRANSQNFETIILSFCGRTKWGPSEPWDARGTTPAIYRERWPEVDCKLRSVVTIQCYYLSASENGGPREPWDARDTATGRKGSTTATARVGLKLLLGEKAR